MNPHGIHYKAPVMDYNDGGYNSYTKYILLGGKSREHILSWDGYNVLMSYLIDGHNLIPKVGLQLDSPDDEMELVAILQEFYRQTRKPIEVYFDGAPAPQAGTRKLGTVTAHFVRLGTTADDAIRKRLKSLGKSAKNWTVISSDRQVQAEANAMRAEVISSDVFAAMLRQARASAPKVIEDRKLSEKEVEEWMSIFQKGKQK